MIFKYSSLLEDPEVKFAGYRHPHPLENQIEVKILTKLRIDTNQHLKEGCERLSKRFEGLLDQFNKNVEAIKHPVIKIE